jgi:hypothetical protein
VTIELEIKEKGELAMKAKTSESAYITLRDYFTAFRVGVRYKLMEHGCNWLNPGSGDLDLLYAIDELGNSVKRKMEQVAMKQTLSDALTVIGALMVNEDNSIGDDRVDCIWCGMRDGYDDNGYFIPGIHAINCAWDNARKFLIETRKKIVADSLDGSLKENSEIWKELANHVRSL